MSNLPPSLETLVRRGNVFYAANKDFLEKNFMGQFAVIDVETEKYEIDPDRSVAIEKAKKNFGEKLFYIVQIGSIQKIGASFSTKKYAWDI